MNKPLLIISCILGPVFYLLSMKINWVGSFTPLFLLFSLLTLVTNTYNIVGILEVSEDQEIKTALSRLAMVFISRSLRSFNNGIFMLMIPTLAICFIGLCLSNPIMVGLGLLIAGGLYIVLLI